MVLIRIPLEEEVEMEIRGVVAKDFIILVIILGLIMVNPLEVQRVFFNFLLFNIRVVLVFPLSSLKGHLNLQDLLVKFVARMVTLPIKADMLHPNWHLWLLVL